MEEPEPRFLYVEPGTLLDATLRARETRAGFRRAFIERRFGAAFYGVKLHFPRPDGQEGHHVWLSVTQLFADLYFCCPIELPSDLVGLKAGETKLATDDDIEDWMIMDNGTLYGGFSLRAIRQQLSASAQAEYDSYMGVISYASHDAV
jgi:uncharacterized protein YegJ (DUF2314 family)